MKDLERHRHLPDVERLSILVGTILLAFALSHFIRLPGGELSIQLPGLYLGMEFGVQELVALLTALLTAVGADWLLQDHPFLGKRRKIEHWLLPGLTAWAIGLPLLQLPLRPTWWLGFTMAGILLILVLVAEYIVVDSEDVRHAPATAVLTVISFALYLVLITSLRFTELRLFLLVPAIGLASSLVCLRMLRLRMPDRWAFLEAGLVSFITIEFAAAFHYWPLSPVSYGLALLGPTYALSNFLGNLAEGEPFSQAFTEPLVVLLLIWGAALWLR